MARQRTIRTFCVSLALWPLSPGRKIVVSFKRKLNMVFLVKSNPEFSSWALEEARPTLVLSSFFVSCEEKDYYRVVSVGQLDFDYRSYCGHSHRRHQANNFFAICEVVAHSMAGHVIEESYHRESRVVINDHQILLSIELEDVSAKFLPWPGWKVWLHNG